jgi:hypothetical protein
MANHRAKLLAAHLPMALATGYSEIVPDLQPMKVCSEPLSHEQMI